MNGRRGDTQGQVWKGTGHRSFCPRGVWGAPPSRHMDVFLFTNPEAQKLLKSCCSRIFLELNLQHPPSLRPVGGAKSSFDLSGDQPHTETLQGTHLKSVHQHKLCSQGTPKTQEILRVLGALCREPEIKTKYIQLQTLCMYFPRLTKFSGCS